MAGDVFAGEECPDRGLVESLDGVRRAENGAADGLGCVGGFHESVVDEVVRRILDGGVFLQDDAFFARKLRRVEDRMDQDVAEHVERHVDVLAQHPRRVARIFDAGGGVDVAAHILDVLGDLPGRAAGRALERHVLDEMRQSVLVRLLVTGAGADPDPKGRGGDFGHSFGCDREAIRKPRDVDPPGADEGLVHAASARCGPGALANEALDGCLIVRQHGEALVSRHEVGHVRRQGGAQARGALDRVGEFRRVGGRQGDHGYGGLLRQKVPRRAGPHGAVRIEDVAGSVPGLGHFGGDARLVDGRCDKFLRGSAQAACPSG